MTKKFLVKTIIEQEVWDLVCAESISAAIVKVHDTQQDPFLYTNCSSHVKSVTEVYEWEAVIRDFHPTIKNHYIDRLLEETIVK